MFHLHPDDAFFLYQLAILMAFFQVNYLIGDGKSHWLEGVLLMMMYLIIALAAWYVLTHVTSSLIWTYC